MELQKLIGEARAAYRASGIKLTVPQPPYIPSGQGYMRASSLGGCELQHAYEKLGVEPDFPELLPEHDPDKAWLMDHGNYVAPMVQEPLMFAAMTTPGISFWPEKPYLSAANHLVVRLDGLLEVEGVQYVLEIKDTEGQAHRSVGEPKLSYALQALAGMREAGTSHGFIITCSKWSFNCYEIRPLEDGFLIYDQWGSVWSPPVWMEDFNTHDQLTFAAVDARVAVMQQSIEQVDRHFIDGVPTPIPDPLNDERGFMCFYKADRGTKTRNGVAQPNCPFAGRCHHVQNHDYAIRKVDGRYEFA